MNQHKRKKHEASKIDGNESISEDNLEEETFREHCEDNFKKKQEYINNTVIEVNEIDASKAKKN